MEKGLSVSFGQFPCFEFPIRIRIHESHIRADPDAQHSFKTAPNYLRMLIHIYLNILSLLQEIYAEWVCDKCFSHKDVPLVKFKP